MSQENFDELYKIVLIGDSGVGKSNILSRYIHDEFSIDTKTTVGVEFGSKIITISNKKLKIQLWDTAGQEKFKAVTNIYYKGAKGALIIYDITRRETFENINKWILELKNNEDNVIIILIGNKSDLEEFREISQEEAFQKAKDLNCAFLETSAMQAVNIEKCFFMLVQEIYKKFNNVILDDKIRINDIDKVIVLNNNSNNEEEENKGKSKKKKKKFKIKFKKC